MSQGRSSLLSDSGLDSIGKKDTGKRKGGSGGSMDTLAIAKLAGGGVVLLAGVFLILKSLGVFEPNPYGAEASPAEAKQIIDQREAETKEYLELNKNVTLGGA